MYAIFISVRINTKEMINLQTKINRHSFFGHYPLSLSFFPHANIGQLMTDQQCHIKIIFFFKKKAIGCMTFGIWQTGPHCIMLGGHSIV